MWQGFVQYGDLSLDSNKNLFHCVYFHVCETQCTRMHVTDTAATPNGHQMAVVTWDRSIRSPVNVQWKSVILRGNINNTETQHG